MAHTCPESRRLVVPSGVCRWSFVTSLKDCKEPLFLLSLLPSLLVFFLSPCLAPFLIRRGSPFDLAGSCCSGSPASRHEAFTAPSLTAEEGERERELPLFLSFTPLRRKKNKKTGESQTLPLLLLGNQTHSPSCRRDNKIIHEFKMASILEELAPRPAVPRAYGPCRM